MLTLIGKQYCKVDSNGRFKFPADLKKQLPEGNGNNFIVRASFMSPCLEIWLENDFKEESKKFQSLNPYNPEEEKLRRRLLSSSPVELDSADRFLIPCDYKRDFNIDKDIVLVSVGNIIEIWDIEKYKELNDDSKNDYAALAAKYLGKKQNNEPEHI